MLDRLLGVVLKAPSASMKQYIVLVLRPDLSSSTQTPSSNNLQDNKVGDFSQGYVLMPKSKRRFEEEYCAVTSRKGSGVINLKLPYQSAAAGHSFEVRGIDNTEFLCICNCKIKIDQVRLLEDCSNAAFSKTVQQLLDLKTDGNKYPPALDPQKGKPFIGEDNNLWGRMNCITCKIYVMP